MKLLEQVNQTGLLFDGAMGTMLMKKGLDDDKVSEQIILDNPDILKEIHQEYFSAGADLVTTNTFGGSRLKLEKADLDDKVGTINKEAAQIARKIAGDKFVAGDLGPSGYMLEPLGEMSEEEIQDNFAEQAYILTEAGVDLILIETMYDLNEILAALQGVKSVTDKPVFTTMTFERKPQGFVTVMGNKVENSMQKLLEKGADVVGANCTIGSDDMVDLSKEIREATANPVMVQPNAGMPENTGEKIIYPEEADIFSDNIKKIKEIGIEVVGGCCGTDPEYIKKINQKIS